MRKRDSKSEISKLLATLNRGVTASKNGGITSDFVLHPYFSIISTLLDFPADISSAVRSELVQSAIIELKKRDGPLTHDTLKDALSKKINLYSGRPQETFTFSAWVVADFRALPRSTTWLGTKISFERRDPFELVPREDYEHLRDVTSRWPSGPLIRVKFSVSARSFADAAEHGEDTLNAWRGAVDLVANYQKAYAMFDGIPTVPNRLPAYPVYLVANATESKTWYSINDAVKIGKTLSIPDKDRVQRSMRWVQGRCKLHFNKDLLQKALRSYCSAVDTTDLHLCLQRLWRTLEILTGTDESRELIRRVALLWRTGDVVSEILQCFAFIRNEVTHTGRLPQLDRVLVDSLRTHVHQTFQIQFLKGHEVKSCDELFKSIQLALLPDVYQSHKRVGKAADNERKRRAAAAPT